MTQEGKVWTAWRWCGYLFLDLGSVNNNIYWTFITCQANLITDHASNMIFTTAAVCGYVASIFQSEALRTQPMSDLIRIIQSGSKWARIPTQAHWTHFLRSGPPIATACWGSPPREVLMLCQLLGSGAHGNGSSNSVVFVKQSIPPLTWQC